MKYVHWICGEVVGGSIILRHPQVSSIPVRLFPKWTSSNPRCRKRGKHGHFKRNVCFARELFIISSHRTSALGLCLAPSPPLRGTTRCSCYRCVDALFFGGRSRAICCRCTAMKEETTARQRKTRSWFKRGQQPWGRRHGGTWCC